MNVRVKYIVITLITLSLMSYLYVKTKSIDLEKHNQLIQHFSEFMLIDSTLNQNILEIRQGLLTFYDSTVGKTNQLHKLLDEIEDLLQQTLPNDFNKIKPLIDESVQTLNTKKNKIELFKSTNAIFTNSLRYLPTATNHLSASLPLDSQGDVVTLLLTEQLRDILIHNYSNDNVILDKFNETNKLLTSIFKKHYKEQLNELDSLQAHAEIIVNNKQKIDNIVNSILQTPSSSQTTKILSRYIYYYNNKTEQINFYQKLLYALSIFLLFYVVYILYRLKMTGRKLQNSIKDLNYQKLAMDQHTIVSIIDSKGIITYANDKFCKISGYAADEAIGKHCSITQSDYHPNSCLDDFKNAINNNQIWHGKIRNKNKANHHYWVDTTLVPFMNDSEKPYQFVIMQSNITDIIKATEKLHLQSAALEVAANGIVITDNKAKILWVNKAFTEITGYSLKDTTNQTLKLLKSGKQTTDFFTTMWDTILEGHAWKGELVNRRKDGTLYPEEQTISPVFDDSGKITHFISIKQDISQRKQTEEALRRSQKMDALGQLSGGIAHDFNNQLGIVIGYLDIIKSNYPENEKVGTYITIALKASTRCIDLTRQLLSFSRNQIKETSIVNLNKVLLDQQIIITRSVTPEINVEYILDDNLWTTRANPGEFQDSILNIAFNARDAMPTGGKFTIETKNKTFSHEHLLNTDDEISGDYVQIKITDTGIGMDAKTIEHIYEPFFTTKPVNKGTGLGMAMVYGYIKHFSGHITIQSEPGAGTCFCIYFPRTDTTDCNQDGAENKIETPAPTGTETILIVDDENDLLKLATRYLQDLGYTTLTAQNAHQAIAILKQKNHIDLLFSDIVMPGGIDGYELAQQAVAIRPDIKFLLTTGHTSRDRSQNAPPRFNTNLLNKPYRKIDVAEKIRSTLDNT